MAGLLRLYWANGGGGLTVQTTQTTGESWARGQQVQQGFQNRHTFFLFLKSIFQIVPPYRCH